MEEIRRQLKSWENAFKEINGRKTTKADLDVAPANIRALYQDYSRLRNGETSKTGKPEPAKFRIKRTGLDFNKPIVPLSVLPGSKSLSYHSHQKKFLGDRRDNLIGGISPKFTETKRLDDDEDDNIRIGQKQFLAYFHAASAEEIGLKRQRLCNLALIDVDDDNSRPTDSEETNSTQDGQEIVGDIDSEKDLAPLLESNGKKSKKQRPKKRRNNDNFVRLDMKRKRIQGKALTKLKGAALKRFLFRQKAKKQRRL